MGHISHENGKWVSTFPAYPERESSGWVRWSLEEEGKCRYGYLHFEKPEIAALRAGLLSGFYSYPKNARRILLALFGQEGLRQKLKFHEVGSPDPHFMDGKEGPSGFPLILYFTGPLDQFWYDPMTGDIGPNICYPPHPLKDARKPWTTHTLLASFFHHFPNPNSPTTIP